MSDIRCTKDVLYLILLTAFTNDVIAGGWNGRVKPLINSVNGGLTPPTNLMMIEV